MGLFSSFIKRIIYAYTPYSVGEKGEDKIARKIEQISTYQCDGRLLQNVYIPTPDGSTTEIDLLYITTKGIVVIESKNYAGYIFGNDQDKNWTVTLYGGRFRGVEKHRFYNPVWQNNAHIRYLKRYLGEEIRTISLIVFSDRSELKSVSISQLDTVVCRKSRLKQVLRQVFDEYTDVMTWEKVLSVYNRLSPLTDVNEEVKERHIANLHAKMNSITQCPRCNGKLVLRTAKSGIYAGRQFYGCSNYPKCRYIKNIE